MCYFQDGSFFHWYNIPRHTEEVNKEINVINQKVEETGVQEN